jgi:hypothetical protein
MYLLFLLISIVVTLVVQTNIQSQLVLETFGRPDALALVLLMISQALACFNSFAFLFNAAWTTAKPLSPWRQKLQAFYLGLLGKKVGSYVFSARNGFVDMALSSLAMSVFLGVTALVVISIVHATAFALGSPLQPSLLALAGLIGKSALITAPISAAAMFIPWLLDTLLSRR